jgi:RNA polymerase sigma-70 factor, ECF subfamily
MQYEGDGLMADRPLEVADEVLITRALRGDEDALGSVLATEQEWAYNVAYRILGRDADARDAVQDAFLITVRALRGDGSPPRSAAGFKPWLRRVVANAAITQVRRRPTTRLVAIEDVADSLPGPDEAEPGRSIEHKETRGEIVQVLLALPERQRVALALREYVGSSYEEIAETLRIPTTAVGTLLFRARSGFRAAYDHRVETAPPIDCPDVVPLFSQIIDRQPRPAEWRELEQHLHNCDRCQAELENQRRARRLYTLIPLVTLPSDWHPAAVALDAASTSTGANQTGGIAGGLPASPPSGPEVGTPVSTSTVVGTSATPAVGSSVKMTAGGLLAGAWSTKLAVATVATATAIGVALITGPLAGPIPESSGSPVPSPGLIASPGASPGSLASPGASPGSLASPGASPGSLASPGASPGSLASPNATSDASVTSSTGQTSVHLDSPAPSPSGSTSAPTTARP